ncbi:MAG TPA: GspH/FimT family protein [Thermoanaerobaculia bacterium]|nr:GspH/FimT family protein [Thermoanaerobaculia bacterium]
MKCVEKGFTLVELIIVLVIIGIAAVIGMPALLNAIRRAETEGGVRQATVELRAARLEAVKHSATVYVEADFAKDQLVTWRENNLTAGLSADDEQLRRMPLPAKLYFWGPGDAAAEGPDATFPASTPVLTFLPDGSIDEEAALRFGDGRNYLEVRVAPRATARVTMLKYNGTDWLKQGENDKRWTWD